MSTKSVTKYRLSAGCGERISSVFCEMIAKRFHSCAAFFFFFFFVLSQDAVSDGVVL